jgi:hypothetical protein
VDPISVHDRVEGGVDRASGNVHARRCLQSLAPGCMLRFPRYREMSP